jgi:hypothetical protein
MDGGQRSLHMEALTAKQGKNTEIDVNFYTNNLIGW